MAGKKTGKRLLTWVLVLVMALSLLPLNALATDGPETGGGSGMNFDKRAGSNGDGTYTITMTAQATGTTTTTTKVEPMDIVLVLDQSGSMGDKFGTGTRQSAMKAAVNSFIGEVANKYSPNADHRMAIVTFSDEAKTLPGWTAVDSTGAAALTSEINDLPKEPEGATNVGAGMELAQTLMDNDAYTGDNTDRQKTVIVFTDGVPTTYSDFDTDVANTAISAAKSMKDNGVTIYTVDIFKGANTEQLYGDSGFDKNSNGTVGSNWSDFSVWMIGDIKNYDVPAGNRFLNYLSSNFENATGVGLKEYNKTFLGIGYHGWEITQNFNRTSSDYYLTASDASSLKNIFKVISDIVPAPGDPALNKDTVITDTLSNYFTFATGTVDGDVKVYAGQRELINGKDITVNLNPTTKTVTVTGYDFSAHHTTSSDPEKLVIKIKVKPSGDGCTSKEIPTNDDDSIHAARVEVEVESEGETKTKIVTSHETAKVTGHQVIYNLDGGTGNITGNGLYYPQGAAVPVTNSEPTREGYKFTGWEITAPKDGETTLQNGKFTMPAADVTLTAQWTESKYKVTYALTDDVKPTGYNVPTDSGEYTKDSKYTVDPTHKEDEKVVDGGYTYTFSGWKLNGAGAVLTGEQTMGNGNVVLKGTWTKTANKYTLIYETNSGTISESANYTKAGEVAFGIKLDTPKAADMTKEGYTFAGWYSDEDLNTPAPDTMPAYNLTLYAKWTANTDTQYTVKHHQQNLDNDNYTPYETESDKTGTTGELTNATAKNYAGFTAKPFVQQAIAADGSTVVDIYYDRNTYSVTYTDGVNDEPIFADEVHQSVKYGAPVPAYNNGTNPTRKNYTFAGWDSTVPDTMPANNLTFTAKWEKKPVGDGTFDFNDVFHDGKNTPAITKTVKGNVGKNFTEAFYVTVKGADEKSTATMATAPYTGKAEVIASKSLKDVPFLFKPEVMANAVVPYGELRFTEAGTYTYTVREEVPGKPSRMSYDTTEYTLTIMVALDEDTNTYQVESWQFTPGNRENLTQLNIVNTYRTYHPSTPSKPTLNTGDHYAYVMGYPDGTVRPNGSITRAEVSAILFRLLSDKTRDEYFTTESSFTDVKAGAWYNNSIATLEKAGVIVDTAKGGAFRPNEAITRAELAAMLAQFSDAKPVKGVKFSDVSAGHWAYEAIAIAAKMGWIEGYPDGTFRPDATITRAEMMTLVNRALERVPSDEDHLLSKRVMLTFPDCKSGDWFYIAVQEATNSHTYERAATEKNGDEQWTALRANRDWTLLEK